MFGRLLVFPPATISPPPTSNLCCPSLLTRAPSPSLRLVSLRSRSPRLVTLSRLTFHRYSPRTQLRAACRAPQLRCMLGCMTNSRTQASHPLWMRSFGASSPKRSRTYLRRVRRASPMSPAPWPRPHLAMPNAILAAPSAFMLLICRPRAPLLPWRALSPAEPKDFAFRYCWTLAPSRVP